MIDFHTHILPKIDDGSRSSEMSMEMLLEEKRQGVSLVAATPHFYADQMSIDRFLEHRDGAFSRIEELRGEAGTELPEIVCGAEVYYFLGIGEAKEVQKLCFPGTNTLLLELPFAQWDEVILKDVKALMKDQKLNLVLAHVERYIGFQKDTYVWDQIMEFPLTPQINAGSFLPTGKFFSSGKQRKFCLRFLEEHPDMIVGTDCHNLDRRPPNLAPALSAIEKELGAEALQRIDKATLKALGR